ncbi:predicted protein [Streptomyces viridochromogenes DSM 40736]|uniref:Predicted protein n=1 Tax=Streptomyces viridochromogenes (strain DSM 40736 / JCM 4977 / BCRC 1201 / Tue 494) TaxID=591159 RepID=D9X4V4_STRVT|nr:predicted protein [Streptomyces viridochromogenes DSM 40736]
MARRDFSLRRVESGAGLAGLAGWVDFWAAMARTYQVDKTARLADSGGRRETNRLVTSECGGRDPR